MNVVDSSGWLEYFADGPGAAFFAPAIEAGNELLVPVISLFEVYKHIYLQRGKVAALQAVAAMQTGKVIELDAAAAIQAAEFSAERQIPMADSVIYTLARIHHAKLWTQDRDLEGLPGVHYQPKM